MKKIAVIGASGLVGEEFLGILDQENHLSSFDVLKFRRNRNAESGEWSLTEDHAKLKDCAYIFNAASSEAARFVAELLSEKQYLIDNSSAFRLDSAVPLVVPEVNGHLVKKSQKIFANPNCTAGILCTALQPLRQYGIKQLIVSTYQAASGAGKEGLDELRAQMKADNPYHESTKVFGYPLAGNVISHNTPIRLEEPALGFNEEEYKVIEETKKILGQPDLPISVTCMRVPVIRAHTETVVVDLEKPFDVEKIHKAFLNQAGVHLVDNPERNHFPMPLEAEGKRDVYVGRFRRDPTVKQRLLFTLSGDQLLKGAAWNAYQIFRLLEEAV